jgi:hypothetical protein
MIHPSAQQIIGQAILHNLIEGFPPELTTSLRKSIHIIDNVIYIDPVRYNIKRFLRDGVIIRKTGSYANTLNKYGSPWAHHKGYVDKAIYLALQENRKIFNIKKITYTR